MKETERNQVIPPLRSDLNLQMTEYEGNQYVLIQDPLGYADDSIAVSYAFYMLSQHFNGDTTYSEFEDILKSQGINSDFELIFDLINHLDESGFLYSENYIKKRDKIESEYLISTFRPSICAGNVFPETPHELTEYLDSFFQKVDKESIPGNAKSIIVPHIDFRIGDNVHKTYAAGYHAIRNTEADLYVIFGTSHYANSDFFMLTSKDYFTPFGILETDKELISELHKYLDNDLTIDDFAHKPEHSIELQTVLLKYYFSGRDFKILPILTGSLHEFILKGIKPESNSRYDNFLDALNRAIKDLGRNPVFISSVDFAHVGRKFGDDYDAAPTLDNLKLEDKILIDALNSGDKNSFFAKIQNDEDKFKICGTAPIYAMLHTIEPKESLLLNYDQWNEVETKSAVSFASLAYYK